MHDPFAVQERHSKQKSSPFEDDFTSFDQFKSESKVSNGFKGFKSINEEASDFHNFAFNTSNQLFSS
jgi:hypothetical protein